MKEEKNRILEEEKLEKVTGGAHIIEDDSGKTYQPIKDNDDPIGTYEASEEGANDPGTRSKSLG